MRKFGLIGYPLGHSGSQEIFENIFNIQQVSDAVYELYPLKYISHLTAFLNDNPLIEGLNVTLPYKRQIIEFIQELAPEAEAMHAVNCIKIIRTKEEIWLKGYNTDMPAFRESLKPYLKADNRKALILGTGGAAMAVAYALTELKMSSTFVARHPDAGQINIGDLKDLDLRAYQLIINATPIGMHPLVDRYPELPYEQLDPSYLLYDLVYNPEMTEFLKRGKAKGAFVLNGLEMLRLQAEMSWSIWNNPEK